MAELLDDRGNWRMDVLKQYLLPVDVEEIIKIRASARLGEDVLAWAPERSGVFSV